MSDAPTTPRDVLVLGGTSWLGGAVARAALDRGHRVTCLARGRSGEVPDGATLVRGDRTDPEAYAPLQGRSWDQVVDVTRQPAHVRTALECLRGAVGHWAFVSTMSVYASDETPGEDESAPLHPPYDDQRGPAGLEDYGPAKVTCERILLEEVPDALVARAGLIVGYGDRSDRFGYWPARFAGRPGEPALVPPLDDPCQVVDVEDLATWLVSAGEQGRGGIANASGPTVSLREVLAAAAEVVGVVPGQVEVSHDWLLTQGVEPWAGPESLPLWLPQPGYEGFMTRDRSRAATLGLVTRPLLDSVASALAWEREQGLQRPREAGLTPARERELVALASDPPRG